MAQTQQNLHRLEGSILTWFSQEAPCQGASAVAAGKTMNTAAEQCCFMEMPLLRGP